MNILLDAFFDQNFGDDLFVNVVTKRYPQHTFYAFSLRYNDSAERCAARIPNLVLLPVCGAELQPGFFGAYLSVGGDVFIDGGDYDNRIAFAKAIHEAGGHAAALGFSLYETYSEATRNDLCTLAQFMDEMLPRDKASEERLKQLAPDKNVVECADLATAYSLPRVKKNTKPLLAISVRKKNGTTQEEYRQLCRAVAAVADAFLQQGPDAKVLLLALSTGVSDDRAVLQDVKNEIAASGQVDEYVFDGDVDEMIRRIGKCTAVLAGRFHAMLMALLYNLPCVPIPYEAKMTQLMEELGYTGPEFAYGAGVAVDEVLNGLKKQCFDAAKIKQYKEKGKKIFKGFEEYAQSDAPMPAEESAKICFACPRLAQQMRVEQQRDAIILEKDGQIDARDKRIAALEQMQGGNNADEAEAQNPAPTAQAEWKALQEKVTAQQQLLDDIMGCRPVRWVLHMRRALKGR